MSRLGFIGTGHIAAPMVRFLAAKGHEIVLTERSKPVSDSLADLPNVSIKVPYDVVALADTVFLCVRPHQAAEALDGLPFRVDHKVVSVMAGVARPELEQLCAPAQDIVQTIPLGYLEKGKCPLAAFGATELLAALFEPENPVVPVASEAALNAHFAICAFVPGVLDLMASASGWLAAETGDADAAEFYTTQLLAGFLDATENRPGGLVAERDALATDGTLSLQMTTALQDAGAHDALREALAAIGERLSKA